MKSELIIGIIKLALGAYTLIFSVFNWLNVGSTFSNSDQLIGLLIGLVVTVYFGSYILYSGFKQIRNSKPKKLFFNIWLAQNFIILFGILLSLYRNPSYIF